MLYFASRDNFKLEQSIHNVKVSVAEEKQIAIGSPLKIELLSVQLSNLDLESKGKPERKEFDPVVLTKVTSATRNQETNDWVRPDLHQLHYDSHLKKKSRFVHQWEIINKKRSNIVHYIPVYEGQTVTVNLNVSELDKPMPEKNKKAFNNIFDAASAVFLPYSPFIQGAKSLFNVFINLSDAGKEHDTFIEEYCGTKWPLSPDSVSACRVVCVQDKQPSSQPLTPLDLSRWKLNNKCQLVDENRMLLSDRCYAVLEFSNDPLPDGDIGLVNSQKAATLLAEIERQKDKEDGYVVVLRQFTSTMKSYSVGKDIQAILKLKAEPSPSNEDKAKLKGYLNLPSIKALGFYDVLKEGANIE